MVSLCQQENHAFLGKKVTSACLLETGAETKRLHRAGDLARAEAPGAHIHVLGCTVDDSLNPLYIGLPGAVGAAVGMGNLDAERNTLIAKLAFGHV